MVCTQHLTEFCGNFLVTMETDTNVRLTAMCKMVIFDWLKSRKMCNQ